MRASFASRLDFARYNEEQPQASLTATNSPNAPLAAASARMNFRREDEAPEAPLNQASWQSVKGRHSGMPTPRHRVVRVLRHRGDD